MARENPVNWVIMPSAIWQRDAFFLGEPRFPLLHGRRLQGMVCAFQRRVWWEVRMNRAEVEALPTSPELVQRAVRDWLLRRATEEQRRLKQRVEFSDCKVATGCTWREYLLAFRQLPIEYRYTRGKH